MFLILISLSSMAQIKKGDKLFSKFEYEKALAAYEKAYNEEASANPYLTRRIGLTYRNLGDIESSAIWFKRTLDLDQSNSLDFLYYAEALKFIEEYDKSIEYYSKYSEKAPADRRALAHLQDPEYYKKLLVDTIAYSVKHLKMNNDNAMFGITKYKDGFLFSSTGTPNPEVTQNYSIFDENPYLDIYSARVNNDYELVDVAKLEGNVNSKYHDGPIAYDHSRKQLYVTRNNIKRGRPVKDEKGRVNLKIYVFDETEDGKWSKKGIDLPFNSENYSVAHPSLSVNGNRLYISSNKEGGHGGTDIYYSDRQSDDTWGPLFNLGPKINTEGDESFPYISNTGDLFFSSDGHPGLGGLDLFKSQMVDGRWSNPVNLAHPINSPRDDISFNVGSEDEKGFFSSNRTEGQIGDDIYFFEHTPIIKVNAFVRDKYTLIPLEGVIAKIFDDGGSVVFEGVTDENGYFEVSVQKGNCNFTLVVGENLDYSQYQQQLDLCDEEQVDLTEELLEVGFIEFGAQEYELAIAYFDEETKEIIEDVNTKIYDNETKELIFDSFVTDLKDISLSSDKDYTIEASKEGYADLRTDIDPMQLKDGKLSINAGMHLMGSLRDIEFAMQYFDEETKEVIADVQTEIYDKKTGELVYSIKSSELDKIQLDPNKDYTMKATKRGYADVERDITSAEVKSGSISAPVSMSLLGGNDVTAGINTGVGQTPSLDNIYYDFDKSNIRSDAKQTLDKLVKLMNKYPDMKVALDSHTDARGSNTYNMKLSERREQSALNYLLNAGIDASRLENEHHGEEQLANNCGNQVTCSENEHQLNRRTTFEILNPDMFVFEMGDDLDLEITWDAEITVSDVDQNLDMDLNALFS